MTSGIKPGGVTHIHFNRQFSLIQALFEDAYQTDGRESPWYHPWNTLMSLASLTSSESTKMFSVAPQIEFASYQRITSYPTRYGRAPTRSMTQKGDAILDASMTSTQLGLLDADLSITSILSVGDTSTDTGDTTMSSDLTEAPSVHTEGKDTYRIPDFAMYVNKLPPGWNKMYNYPFAIMEIKPPEEDTVDILLYPNNSPEAKNSANSIIDSAMTQIREQARFVFEQYTLEFYPEFQILYVYGVAATYFRTFRFVRNPEPGKRSFTTSTLQNIFNADSTGLNNHFYVRWNAAVLEAKRMPGP